MKRLFIILISIVAVLLMVSSCGGDNTGDNNDTITYTITYTNQAGEIASRTIDTQTGVSLDVQAKEGYSFLGYFTGEGIQYFDGSGNQLSSILIDKDLTLIPKFEPYKYTIVLDAQTGIFADNTSKHEIQVQYGENLGNIVIFPVATTERFEFDGWFNEDGSVRYSNGKELIGAELTNQNYQLGENGSALTLYAKFKVKELTVILDYNDGATLPQEFKVSYGEGFGDLSQYSLDNGTNYIRTWSSSSYGEVKLPDLVTADMRIYAVWQNYKKVNFVYSSTITKEEKVDVTVGQSSVLPENAILPGYKFQGWYSSQLLSGNPITVVPYGSLQDTYYAKWQETDYSLDFVTGTSDNLEQIRYHYGDTTALPELTRTGYTFEGWSTGEGDCFKSIPSTLYGDLTLVAVWTPNKVAVTLDADGGRLNDYSIEIDYESYYTLEIPTRLGYDFVGWYNGDSLMANEMGEALQPWKSLEGATFVAKWEIQIFTVEYATDSDSVTVESQEYEYGQKIVLPMNLKNGELFLEGWYYDEELNNRVSINANVKSNLTLYANWCEMLPISTVDDLKSLADNSDFIYYLENDINLNGENWTPIPEFKGILYGKGHKLYNFSLSSTENIARYGIFATNSGKIYDVVVDDFTCNVSYGAVNATVGILVGYNTGTVSGCKVTSGTTKIITSTPSENRSSSSHSFCFGNLVGRNEGGTVSDCTTDEATIEGNANGYRPMVSNILTYNYRNYVTFYGGGIVGYSTGTVCDCNSEIKMNIALYATCYSDGIGYSTAVVGGIVGETSENSMVKKCTADVQLASTTAGNSGTHCYAGGIAGMVNGNALESTSKGKIAVVSNADTRSGGIAGHNKGEISDCYSLATVSGGRCGGIIGNNLGTVRNCVYAPTEETEIGLCGTNEAVGTVSKSISLTLVGVANNAGTSSKVYSLNEDERAVLLSYAFLIEELYWDETVWTVDKGGMFIPTLHWENE